MWNDDWDGSPLVLDDYLYEGGENSQFHVVKLNRTTGDDGLVQVAPVLVFNTPGWDQELISALETRQNDVSIENSVAYFEGVVYFANSGGLVQGWDVSGLPEGVEPTRVLRYWAGDDIDASIVVDEEGFLYVGVEKERGNARAEEVGQLIKLDPDQPDDPLVWSVKDSAGFWTTPALHGDIVIAASDGGTVYGVDRQTGEVRWTFQLPPPTWQSAVVVDDTLIQGDCEGGLHAYDLSDTTVAPPELWTVDLDGCIESTPALWHGRLFVGTRGGSFYAIGDA
jgi:outer membrane protein assembly factor BamB